MPWCARLLAALLLTLVGGTGGVAAHIGGSAYIVVTADFILPGGTFEVIASDVGPDASVTLRIEHELTVAPLGTIKAAPDGHFMTSLVLPGDFPTGYAQLFAAAVQGAVVSTWVYVGEPSGATPLPPGTSSWWADPSVVVLLLFVVGAVALVGYLILRPRTGRVEHVRAAQRGVHRPRKRDSRPGK